MKTRYSPIIIYSDHEDSNYVNQLKRVLGVQNYKGVLIHSEGNGKYKVFNEIFDSLDAAKERVDRPLILKNLHQ